ncbi:MAG: Flp family type IVb pilin [Armatimonadetes bacterium]|nr:Flp family type IVb pilin [Armatimonadota bacterium]
MLDKIKSKAKVLVFDEDGHVLIEYGVVLALIAIACITIVGEIGNKTNVLLSNTASKYP